MADKIYAEINRIYYNRKRGDKVIVTFDGFEDGQSFIFSGTLKEAQELKLIGDISIVDKKKHEALKK